MILDVLAILAVSALVALPFTVLGAKWLCSVIDRHWE